MSFIARVYIAVVVLAGFLLLLAGLLDWQSNDPTKFFCYLVVAVLASGLKVSLPAVTGTMSVNFLFILVAIVDMSLSETLFLGCTATLIQCIWHAKKRPRPEQILFNIASITIAIWVSYYVHHSPFLEAKLQSALVLVLSTCTFFAANTFPVAAVIALTEDKRLRKVWQECYFWSFPYYLLGAAIAALVSFASGLFGWQNSLLFLPVVFVIYRSYRLYLDRLEAEKVHAEEIASLHLRTIEALALAIEAKDHTTHDHLQRVQVYATEVAKELGLKDEELEAMRAAALLHDIGKLAVPEHIISKPGKLTREEFEKMKIHPVVGAEILERVRFPYPVVPIVRSHHERWDGSGYPAGLKAEEIPIGARILAAVDCLDALASHRQYRRALPLDEAMQRVAAESGTSFDPRVVEVLQRRYLELDKIAREHQGEPAKLSTELKIERGEAPGAGFEVTRRGGEAEAAGGSVDFLASIAAARQEVQALFELSQDLGNSLSLNETLSVLAVRLKRMVPHDAIAIYIQRDGRLIPEYVSGENFRLFSSLSIPTGQGLSGWVAENRKPIVNGNPSVEPGYLNDPSKFSTMRSALAVPLEGLNGIVGVLTLYQNDKDAFTNDHLRVLLGVNSKLAFSIENALKFRQVESSASTDYLTALPNARSLFLHLDSELARCRRAGTSLAILVCDLDGFKQVNDRFGHLEGNNVLRTVAHSIKESCREYDYVARMGGDEFVLVLPGLKREALEVKIARLRVLACEAGRQVCGDDLLSISAGEAFYPEDGNDAERLLAEADRRMYQNKQDYKRTRHAAGTDVAAEWQPVIR